MIWDRQQKVVVAGHRYASKGMKLENPQVTDRKVCNRLQKLSHSKAKNQTASCKNQIQFQLIFSCVSRVTPTPYPPYFCFQCGCNTSAFLPMQEPLVCSQKQSQNSISTEAVGWQWEVDEGTTSFRISLVRADRPGLSYVFLLFYEVQHKFSLEYKMNGQREHFRTTVLVFI